VSAALIDANIFVYAYDPADPVKHDRAIRLIDEVSRTGNLALSVQVLNELAWTLLRKGAAFGLSREDVRDIVDEVALSARILPVTPDLTRRALEVGVPQGLAFWDALIWAVADRYEIPTFYTEDFQHGRTVESVRFVNPFLLPP
jgi:predicted nucleic acid-binding protein